MTEAGNKGLHAGAGQPHGAALRQVFRREGEYWTIIFTHATCRLKDTRGMHHLAVLLARPGERIPAVELAALPLADSRTQAAAPATSETTPAVDAERARVNVTRHLASVMKRIAVHHPALGRHLATTIRTGTWCSYTPDARLPILWEQ